MASIVIFKPNSHNLEVTHFQHYNAKDHQVLCVQTRIKQMQDGARVPTG